MAPLRPTERDWKPVEMTAWLQALQVQANDARGATSSAYIHPNALRFTTDRQKGEWVGYYKDEDMECMDSFGRLEKKPKGGRKTWVAAVVGPCESYVGKKSAGTGMPQWEMVEDHMWAVAIVDCGKKGAGKNLYIFDCDAAVDEGIAKHAKDLAVQLQRQFVHAAKK